MYKLILSPVLLWSLLASALPAQIEQPRVDVTVRFEPNQASPGDKVTLVIEGLIEPGYHLYGKKFPTANCTLILISPHSSIIGFRTKWRSGRLSKLPRRCLLER
jgi:hypothetical protein